MTPSDVVPMLVALGALAVSLRGNKRNDFDSLRDELRKQLDSSANRILALETRVIGLEVVADTLEQKVTQLTTWRAVAVLYIHRLQAALRRAGVPVPDAPIALDLTDEEAQS